MLYDFQAAALDATKHLKKVAYFWEMGTGKTFVGAAKLASFEGLVNLVVCPKSVVKIWVEHFEQNHPFFKIFDLTIRAKLKNNNFLAYKKPKIGIINYELLIRRAGLLNVKYNTLLIDESSYLQNRTAKRTRAICAIKSENLILLSGTPVAGKYEKLYTQLKLLGLPMTQKQFWDKYVNYTVFNNYRLGIAIKNVVGYKNIPDLKQTMRDLGCRFLKADDVCELPEKVFTKIEVDNTADYKHFLRDRIIKVGEVELIGDTILNLLLYSRLLCGAYNPNKIAATRDLLNSTEDRVIIFYNFEKEREVLVNLCDELGRPFSQINGKVKDLKNYNNQSDSITLIQYQAGSLGLNLQLANKVIYFTPPLSCEHWLQSAKRTNRIGQSKTCFYYVLSTLASVEQKILEALDKQKDFTELLFVRSFEENGA